MLCCQGIVVRGTYTSPNNNFFQQQFFLFLKHLKLYFYWHKIDHLGQTYPNLSLIKIIRKETIFYHKNSLQTFKNGAGITKKSRAQFKNKARTLVTCPSPKIKKKQAQFKNGPIFNINSSILDAWQLTFSPAGFALRLRLFFIIVSGLGYAKRPELYAWQLG